MIEVLVRWTELSPPDPEDAEKDRLNRLISGDEAPGQLMKMRYDHSPMTFELNDVVRYNQPHDPNYTTIRFTDGDSYVVKIPYEKFHDVYTEGTGKSPYSYIKTNKQEDKPDITDLL